MRVKDKVTVITGAASGIGRAAAVLFAGEGAILHISDIDEKGLEETCGLIREGRENVFASKVDVTKAREVTKEIDDVAFEGSLHVDRVEGDAERGRDPARVGHLVGRATAISGRVGAALLGPQSHHHAYHVVALLDQQGRTDGAIHAATHCDDDACRLITHCGPTQQYRQPAIPSEAQLSHCSLSRNR